MVIKYKGREEWLMALAEKLRPLFDQIDVKLPERYRISLSLMKGLKVGVCYDVTCSADHTWEILIKIDRADPLEVAAILAHELIHAAIGLDEKHGNNFKKVALGLGLEGKMRATRPGERFIANTREILASMGPFPHAKLNLDGKRGGPPKQTTRLRKAECKPCGYTVRVTDKWLKIGNPHCPAHGKMFVDLPTPDVDPNV